MERIADNTTAQANACLMGIFNCLIKKELNRTPPAFASKPASNPIPNAAPISLEAGILSALTSSAALTSGFLRAKEYNKVNPIVTINKAVRIIKVFPGNQLLIHEPAMVEGTAITAQSNITLALKSFSFRYTTVAESVLVIDAGKGDAKAKNGFIPAKIWSAGVLIALPPFPSNPER